MENRKLERKADEARDIIGELVLEIEAAEKLISVLTAENEKLQNEIYDLENRIP